MQKMQKEEASFNTFVCIEAGIKEMYVIVVRDDKAVINLSYPYDSNEKAIGKATGKAVMWFGKNIESGDNQKQIERDNETGDVCVYAGDNDCTIMEKNGTNPRSSSSLIQEALEFIKGEVEKKSKEVFEDSLDWKKTKVGITSRTDMTYQLKSIMKKVFKESSREVVFVTHCLTAIPGDYDCYEIEGFGIAKDHVEVDLSGDNPKKSVTLVDSTYESYKPKGGEMMVTPEKVAWALNSFMKKRKSFNDVDPIQISLIGMGSSKCFYNNQLLQDSIRLLPPKDPCTSIPLFFEFVATNSKVRAITSTSMKLSKEMCLPTEVITSKVITLTFAYSNHTLSITYDYDLNNKKKQEVVSVNLPKSILDVLSTVNQSNS